MINFSHPIYSALRNVYGLAAFKRKGVRGNRVGQWKIAAIMMNKMVVCKGTLLNKFRLFFLDNHYF